MKLKPLLAQLFSEHTPHDEERTPSPSTEASNRGRTADGDLHLHPDDGDLHSHPDDDDDNTLPNAGSHNQPDSDASPRPPPRFLSRVLSSVFPSPSPEDEIQAYIPHYRIMPIFSGITIPFCILLEIPGLTAHWYVRMDGSTIVASKPNPPLLDVGLALSMACAVLANICLVMRFLERRIKAMTILCIVFLSIHDIINVVALATFGVSKDDYTYGQAFWMTLCSTIASLATNVTLIVDFVRIPDFERSGSGLTRRQRSLVIIIIGLFCYIGLGALINSLLLNLSFINGLYFTVVTIETIGFGDIVPHSRASRVFICFYATLGVINLAFVVGYVRESVLESLDFGYRRRLLAIQERRRAARRRRHAENRWRHAIVWRLREREAPVWIPQKNRGDRRTLSSKLTSGFWRAAWGIRSTARRNSHHSHRRHGMKLNLWALPQCELEAAALESGVPLDTLLPAGFYDTYDQDACNQPSGVDRHSSWFMVHPVYHREEFATDPLTHTRLGAMAAMLTKFGLSIYESGGDSLPSERPNASTVAGAGTSPGSSGSLYTSSSDDIDGDYRADVAETEKKAYYTRSGLSWGWFLIFWMGGAAIFKATEGWTYGLSIYFCFISFSTIGYGDLSPTTPAGRSIFVVWALVGVATMTIFISVVSEAYTTRYKGIMGRNSFKHAVQQYRQRTKVDLSEKVQEVGTTTVVRFLPQESLERPGAEAAEGDSPPASAIVDDSIPAPAAVAAASSSTTDPLRSSRDARSHAALQALEQLPEHVLTEMRSIQLYMRLVGDLDGRPAETGRYVDERIWRLVDDVMGGRKLSENTKMDMLRDDDSRRTLMMLGMERCVKEVVDVAEQTIAAFRDHRDGVVGATLDREKGQYEAEGEWSR